ncbi:hypothetical protein BJX66DRAFT_344284 [Aspergillus keveii]|uniref:Uncharacterized protein n=1 Tax=Aspergillus keveii TaxID=714993 RepID=A0ABR4FLP7_9EURO
MQTSPSTRDTWTIEDRQRLLRLRQTFSVLSWRRFHKLRLFPRRSENALAAQWYFIQRQRTQLGITDGDDEADNGGGLTPRPDNNEGMGGLVSDLDRARSATDGDQEVREYSDTRAVGSDLDAGAADRDDLEMLPRSADATVPTNARSSTKHRIGIVILKLPPRLLAQQIMDRSSRASAMDPCHDVFQTLAVVQKNCKHPRTEAESKAQGSFWKVQHKKKGAAGPSLTKKCCRRTSSDPATVTSAWLVITKPSIYTCSTPRPKPEKPACPSRGTAITIGAPIRALAIRSPRSYENIGETLRRFCSREANKHTRLRDKIQALQNQGHAITNRITKLEEQAAKARRNSDRAQMFLQRPDMFLTLDASRLHSWMRTMDTSEPQDSSTLQTNGDYGHVDEKRVIVLDD